jgi:hypothetical protein
MNQDINELDQQMTAQLAAARELLEQSRLREQAVNQMVQESEERRQQQWQELEDRKSNLDRNNKKAAFLPVALISVTVIGMLSIAALAIRQLVKQNTSPLPAVSPAPSAAPGPSVGQAVLDVTDDGLLNTVSAEGFRNHPTLQDLLDRIRLNPDGLRAVRNVTATTASALPTGTATAVPPADLQPLADKLAQAMRAGGVARGGATASDVQDVLGQLAAKTGVAHEDLTRAYIQARDAASAALGATPPTSADYQKIMNDALAGVDTYLTNRAETVTYLETFAPISAAPPAQGWSLFPAASAAELPPPGGPGGVPRVADVAPAAAAGGGFLPILEGGMRVAGGAMAVWAVVGAVQAMRRKDADSLDRFYYGTRAVTGAASALGIANPFTAAIAMGATAVHMSRAKTLAQLTEATAENHATFERLKALDTPGQWAQFQKNAQLAVCVASGLGIKASKTLSTQLNAARVAAAGGLGWAGEALTVPLFPRHPSAGWDPAHACER